MSEAQQPKIDQVQIAKGAAQHEIRVQPGQNEMKLARTNSTTAHALADGVREVKGAKITAAQKEKVGESLPHIAKGANNHAIKSAARLHDMEVAESNHDTAHALAEGVREVKGAKVTAAQKEKVGEALPHITKGANNHAIKSAARIHDMEVAESNHDTAKALAEGVREVKGAKIQEKTKENKLELNKSLSQAKQD